MNINHIFKQTTLYSVQKADLKKCAELMASAFSTDPSLPNVNRVLMQVSNMNTLYNPEGCFSRIVEKTSQRA